MNQTDLILNQLGQLKAIWERDNRTELEQFANKPRDIIEANEYAYRLIQLWDYLDTLPLEQVENIQVELEGKLLGDRWDTIDKILKTQIIHYMIVRVQQDGQLQDNL